MRRLTRKDQDDLGTSTRLAWFAVLMKNPSLNEKPHQIRLE
jgi:hypothetical protein